MVRSLVNTARRCMCNRVIPVTRRRWQLPESLRLIELTASEALVLDGLARGMTAAAIAAETFLSVNTIKTHTRTLYRKLGVSSRAEALVRAHKLGVRDTWRVPQP